MLEASDILQRLQALDERLKAAQDGVKDKLSSDSATSENGYLIGLQMARTGIRSIFADVQEDNARARRLLRAIFEETGENRGDEGCD